MRKFFSFIVALLLFLPYLRSQQIYFVDLNAISGQQNGTSWSNAFINLQTALSAAQHGDEIWVAKGVYYPTDSTNRSISFELKNGIRLLGGFNGTELTADQRDPLLNVTRLSGNIGDSGSIADNSYHVLRGRGLDATSVLDGFTISDGFSIGAVNSDSDSNGAGLYLVGSTELSNSHPLISNCRFEFNIAGGVGGGIFASFHDQDDPFMTENLVNPILRNCIFDSNQADVYGGAICKEGPTGDNDSFLIEDCRFTRNYVYALDGGGVFFARANQSKIIMKRCLFESNTAHGGQGGGFSLPAYEPGGYTTDLYLDSCVFKKNLAPEGGGFLYDGLSTLQPDLVLNLHIIDCLFEENDAKNANGGAYLVTIGKNGKINAQVQNSKFVKNRTNSYFTSAFLCYDKSEANVIIEKCDFLGNININDPTFYCAAFDAGGHNVNTRINNCLFANNGSAIFAGGYEDSQILTQITNCTFYQNNDQPLGKRWYPSYNQAGAIYYNNMNFYNCVIWETQTTNRLIYNTYPAVLTGFGFFFDYCSFHPMNPGGLPNASQVLGDSIFIGEYPDFVDTTANNFRLKTCSPTMNRGSNQAALDAGLVNDLDGLPRIRFTTVDLGAYETQDSCITIASKEPQSNLLSASLSPNPSLPGSPLAIEVSGVDKAEIAWILRDALGRQISSGKQHDVEKTYFSIDAPASAGIYLVEIRSGSRSIWLKFIVQS